jgi:hypothetical protein
MKKPKKPVIGPVTKKAAMKSAPKVPMTPVGVAAKKKKMATTAAAIGAGVVAGVTKMAVDARINRGGLRIQDKNANIGGNAPQPTTKEKWRAGKNKKSTKK